MEVAYHNATWTLESRNIFSQNQRAMHFSSNEISVHDGVCSVGFSLVWMICHGHNAPRGSNWGPTKADSQFSLKVNTLHVVTFSALPGNELRVTENDDAL